MLKNVDTQLTLHFWNRIRNYDLLPTLVFYCYELIMFNLAVSQNTDLLAHSSIGHKFGHDVAGLLLRASEVKMRSQKTCVSFQRLWERMLVNSLSCWQNHFLMSCGLRSHFLTGFGWWWLSDRSQMVLTFPAPCFLLQPPSSKLQSQKERIHLYKS